VASRCWKAPAGTCLTAGEKASLDRSIRAAVQHQQVLRLRLRDLSGTMVYASDGAGTITETALLTDPDRAALTLQRRADAGVRISIDKFGVGQTSLRCLASLPIHELKINRAIVMPIRRRAAQRRDRPLGD